MFVSRITYTLQFPKYLLNNKEEINKPNKAFALRVKAYN